MMVNLFLEFLLETKKMAIKPWYWRRKKLISLSTISTLDGIHNVINLIKPNVYMTSVDLKDAFLSVSIHNDHQKFLKFMFGNLFQLHPCLMVMDFLWEYLLKHQKYLLDIWEAKVTTQLYMKLIHISKDMRPCLTQSQTILFFGFIILSKHITLSSTDEKKNKIKALLTNYLHSH